MANRAASIIQATFAPGKEPSAQKPSSPVKPADKRDKPTKGPDKGAKAKGDDKEAALPPHPATLSTAQRKAAEHPGRPPHPATLQRKEAAALGISGSPPKPPHPATLPRGSQRAGAVVQGSFEAPPRLLEMGSLKMGKPLPPAIQRALEEQFDGADFSEVRIQEGPEATAIGALALTAGDQIFFAPGHYQPETKVGRSLLAKQLAYVIQQREGRVKNPFGNRPAIVCDPALDAEASAHAAHR